MEPIQFGNCIAKFLIAWLQADNGGRHRLHRCGQEVNTNSFDCFVKGKYFDKNEEKLKTIKELKLLKN